MLHALAAGNSADAISSATATTRRCPVHPIFEIVLRL
jgi:hypothetical protein